MLTLLAVLSLSSVHAPARPPQEGPPGLLFVPGGRTRIGSTRGQVEELVLQREELAFVLAGETPQFTREVQDFFLMPTEVTNEQYAEFVRATGARPPRSWGVAALQAGQAEFLDAQGKQMRAARDSGRLFEPKVFDPEAWWAAHWREVDWAVPADGGVQPVVFVTHEDAERYARWAGLRLMTEFEFQRAARGDSARIYPWGNQWDDEQYCRSLHAGEDVPAAVGSYPDGASEGFFDLAGNVWEWTSSSFEPFPGYEAMRVTKGRRTIECLAPFDAEQRVLVGGSFHMDRIGVRIGARMNADRTQSTNALGFRCAASPTPGLDASQALIEQELDLAVLRGAELAPEHTLIWRHWDTVPGESSVPGYGVIGAYRQVLFCPRRDVAANSPGELADLAAREGPVFLGFLDVARPCSEPALEAGTYFVAWRGASGSAPQSSDRQGLRLVHGGGLSTPIHAVPGVEAGQDCFLFYSAKGEPRATLEAPATWVAKARAGSLDLGTSPAADAGAADRAADTLRFTIPVPSQISPAKAFYFDLTLRVAPGSYSK